MIALIINSNNNSIDVENTVDENAPAVIDTNANASNVANLRIESSLGEYKYTGAVDENQLPNGVGEAIFTDGRQYRGPFVKGILTGQNAYFRYPNGDVFEGTFKDNSFFEGKYTIADDGSYFIGTFKNGQPNRGTWYDNNGNKL